MKETLYPSFGILLVDDEPAWLRTMAMTLGMEAGINHIHTCHDARDVMVMLKEHDIGLVLLDINMPHISGRDILPRIIEEHPGVSIIVITGQGQVDIAVDCMQKGAIDFYMKTVEVQRLIKGVTRAIRAIELERENKEIRSRFLTGTLEHPECFSEIITRSDAMQSVFQYIEAIGVSSRPVLITGESGVGKELIARAIHTLSERSGMLLAVNVAGLDDTVFSSTLFGHEKGAYTGAHTRREGMVRKASGGTLFLDEIGDLSIASQVKLLRLLQEGEYYRLGSDTVQRMNTRIVVATHQDLAASQASGKLRKDLYYRLCSHHIHVPPLRNRKEDIPLLLDHFIDEASREFGKKRPTYPKELPLLLENYHFPGNVRELKGMVFNAVSLHKNRILSMSAFKKAMDHALPQAEPDEAEVSTSIFVADMPLPHLKDVSSLLIEEALKRSRGNQSMAARLLGVSQPALSKRLKKMAHGS